MTLISTADRPTTAAIAALATTNPFGPARVELERTILSDGFVELGPAWSFDPSDEERANVVLIDKRAEELHGSMRDALVAQKTATDDERQLYEGLTFYLVFSRFEDAFYRVITEGHAVDFYADFEAQLARAFDVPGVESATDTPHLFALAYQLRRAFHYTYRRILGASRAAGALRAAVWESIFTHDLDRYRAGLYRFMHEVPTLITGRSGTGKELVASAIGWSRYISYNPARGAFNQDPARLFQPLNLSALSPTLIESELFGHHRGAFTGAIQDRDGYLCQPSEAATIFLDEIGDVDPGIQVKLLRVLETRSFNRLGDAAAQRFEGKIIAATHRDLTTEIAEGRFREDFYYRLCADRIETPSLAAQLADGPDELERIVRAIAHRLSAPAIVDALTEETMTAIEEGVGFDYAWPGNVRELEQCVKNVLVRKTYRPADAAHMPRTKDDQVEALFRPLPAGALSADDVLSRYCTLVYVQAGSYEEAARRLLLDRRTVKRRVDPEWVARLTES